MLNSIDEFIMKDSKIYLIGAFPPPVHGMSIVNDAIRGKIISLGIQPIVIDLSDSSLNRLLYSRLFRIRKILRAPRKNQLNADKIKLPPLKNSIDKMNNGKWKCNVCKTKNEYVNAFCNVCKRLKPQSHTKSPSGSNSGSGTENQNQNCKANNLSMINFEIDSR